MFQFGDGHNQPLPDQDRQVILDIVGRILEPRPHFANRDTKLARREVQMIR